MRTPGDEVAGLDLWMVGKMDNRGGPRMVFRHGELTVSGLNVWPASTWQSYCGRAGWVPVCEACKAWGGLEVVIMN